jgi:hypothetical protein
VTLVELLVVLVILGAMAGIVGLGWRPDAWSEQGSNRSPGATVLAARRAALESGAPVSTIVQVGQRTVQVLALPDGSVVGPPGLGVDPLTGAMLAEQQRH